jgi:hypothetical protein
VLRKVIAVCGLVAAATAGTLGMASSASAQQYPPVGYYPTQFTPGVSLVPGMSTYTPPLSPVVTTGPVLSPVVTTGPVLSPPLVTTGYPLYPPAVTTGYPLYPSGVVTGYPLYPQSSGTTIIIQTPRERSVSRSQTQSQTQTRATTRSAAESGQVSLASTREESSPRQNRSEAGSAASSEDGSSAAGSRSARHTPANFAQEGTMSQSSAEESGN